MYQDDERLLTRPECVTLIQEKIGAPVTKSRFDKDAMLGLAPRPAAYYGRMQLYRSSDAIMYGRSLLSRTPRRLRGSGT
jgi:hypothetical protein